MHDSHHIEQEPATISIQNLSAGYTQPLDFCVPVTRSHPGDEDQRRETLHGDTRGTLAIEHIDISTAWNGLSDVDAEELFRVHRAFVSTLEKMLTNELWHIYQQLQQQDSAGDIRPVHTLFSTGLVRGISFCRDQLVSEMAEALYSSKGNRVKAKSGFLRLYLIATDALVQYHEHGSRDTSIAIRMRCDPLSLRSYPVVDAAWVPDSLMFESLDQSPLEGQSFSIVPRYYSKSAFRPTRFPTNVKYSIEGESRHRPLSWLVWDDEIAGFKGVVPVYSEVNSYDRHLANIGRDPCKRISNPLNIIVQAVLVDDNGSSVRYERILRARLTINVVPWYANDNSHETEERSSASDVYENTGLASAAQRFALQGRRGSSPKSGKSPSTLSQRSGGAHLYMPSKYAHITQVGLEDNHSAMSTSATGAGSKETDLPDLVQSQAYLVAKCAEMKRELENLKQQVMMSDHLGTRQNKRLQVPYPQEYLDDTQKVQIYHHSGHNRPFFGSSVPRASHEALEHLTTPRSPSLHGGDATFQLRPAARFSVLPPPATDPTTSPTLGLQTSNKGNTLGVTGSSRDSRDPTLGPSTTSHFAAPNGDSMIQEAHSTQVPGYLWHMPENASVSSNDTSTAHSYPRQHADHLSTPLILKSELATLSSSGERGRKRYAKSSLNEISHFERSKETGKQPRHQVGAHSAEPGKESLALLDSEDEESSTPNQSSSSMFYNSFDPLRDLISSTTPIGEDVLAPHASDREAFTKSSENMKHHSHDTVFYVDTEIMDSDEMASKTSPVSPSLNDCAAAAEIASSNSFFPDWKEQVNLCHSSLVSLSPQHARASSTSSSQSTSSDIGFIVEQDSCARKVSRREQAKLWTLLSRSEGDKGNQPGPEGEEVRLSEDEKKAMDEAMQRSLDDLAKDVVEDFNDIFLQDSNESNSGDEL